MDVQLPDGTLIKDVPDGISKAELTAKLASNGYDIRKLSAAQQVASDPITRGAQAVEATPAELIAGSAPARFAMGAAAPIIGGAQLLANVAGAGEPVNKYLSELEQLKQRGMKAYGQEGVDIAGLAGNVLSPVGLAAAKAIPAAGSYMGRIGQGAAVGGVAGATSPITTEGGFWLEKGIQTTGGAVAGGGISAVAPIITGAGKAGYRALIEPWANPAAIKGRAFLEAAGDKAEEILALLRQNKALVPGAAPTAGEAATEAGSTGFSALQKSASGVRGVADQYVGRTDAQNAARIAAIGTVGKDEVALNAVKGVRAKTGEEMYGAIRNNLIKTDPGLNSLLSRPSMNKVFARAAELAKENDRQFQVGINAPEQVVPGKIVSESGAPLTQTVIPAQSAKYPIESLQYVKTAMDDLIKNPERFGIGASEARAISNTRSIFTQWLEKKSPEWAAARARYAIDSRPINQMEVGQYLEKKLVPALSEEARQKAGSFAAAVQDAAGTIKRGTGQPRYQKLEEVLDTQQMQAVQSVRDDLARGARFEDLARAGAKGGVNAIDVATQSMEQGFGGKVPNLLSRTAMVANAIVSRLEGKINGKLAIEIATDMLNPPVVGESMSKAIERAARNKALAMRIDAMRIPALSGAVQGASRETQ